jgi:hypothetical protein
MKKNRGDEQIGVKIHTYMKMSQGNSLCSYLKLVKNVIIFSFTKPEKRRVEQVLPGKGY